MSVQLRDYQMDAIDRMHNGSILCGGVGSGKSLTAIGYYYIEEGGGYLDGKRYGYRDDFVPMEDCVDLYIITTARKRDTKEWEGELAKYFLNVNDISSPYHGKMKVVVDSWNNIKKYIDVKDSFFIFDEQRVVGSGTWVKSFLKITKFNHWILLSATPGDTWMDYVPVFIANGYFKNRTEFTIKHVVYNRFSKFPQVDRYLEQGKLIRYRNAILVNMDYTTPATAHYETLTADYDRVLYRDIMTRRWNIYEDEPIENASGLCYVARRAVNSDPSRLDIVREIVKTHPKVIIFYNYDYELEILKNADWGMDISVAEWNGHKHQAIPRSERWVYLVQYTAGAEGWNCIETDTMIFYSLNYSYKIMVQSAGRIDRMNTPFKDLYYYRLKSSCPLDLAISRALKKKKNFNENKFCSF